MPKNNQQILFISSYPPRECGIATYSKDLLNHLNNQFSNTFTSIVCALENGIKRYKYDDKVKYSWNVQNKNEALELADKINKDKNIGLVLLQHEFGLFGGDWGEDIIPFMMALSKPIITTFHTILPNPTTKIKELVKRICQLSYEITVMTHKSLQILNEEYQSCSKKVSVIPHGTHSVLKAGKKSLKEKYGLKDNLILSTFGLLGPNKSIETALDALPSVIRNYPNVKYLVLGKTHPGIVKTNGESYRTYLEEKCEELRIQDNVIFVNKYLSLDELLDYLNLTDIYLFTSKDPNQAVSGTFSYARSCGCPVVATNIPHAVEFLKDGSGLLIDFENPKQLGEAVEKLLSDSELRKEMGKIGFEKSLESSWENVSIKYAGLFKKALNLKTKLRYNLPSLNFNHLFRMQTEIGILRFADIAEPIEAGGYSLQDNSLAAIAYSYKNKLFGKSKDSAYAINKFINFLEYCQFNNGSLANYVDGNGLQLKIRYKENFLKANALALWALGELVSNRNIQKNEKNRCLEIAKKLIEWLKTENINASSAISIKGLSQIYEVTQEEEIKSLVKSISIKLVKSSYSIDFYAHKDFQVYDEVVISEALIYSYLVTKNEEFKLKANEILKGWTTNIFTSNDSINAKIDSQAQIKNTDSLIYPEDPIHLAHLMSSLNTFYKITESEKYLNRMDLIFGWFLGDNNQKRMMYNPSSGGCYSRMSKSGIDINQNASSTIAYLMSRLILEMGYGRKNEIKEREKRITREIG